MATYFSYMQISITAGEDSLFFGFLKNEWIFDGWDFQWSFLQPNYPIAKSKNRPLKKIIMNQFETAKFSLDYFNHFFFVSSLLNGKLKIYEIMIEYKFQLKFCILISENFVEIHYSVFPIDSMIFRWKIWIKQNYY